MTGTVLLSTHDLNRAGLLRDAFAERGLATDLVTPEETLSPVEGPAVLILTGVVEEGEGKALATQAIRVLEIPVFAYSHDDGAERARIADRTGLDEVFHVDAAIDEILLVTERTLQRRHLQDVTGIIGETGAMREVLERVVQIAPVTSTVLILGESGTGKELVARGIRALSPRKHKPFIAVNVAALPDTLLESELFGHEKGAFTGAVDSRRGLFELADGGTIFLDEIGEMPLNTQTKLLRVLEQREFLRLGGETPIKVDVRIIAATNQDLRQLVAIGEFRRDLYYRLNVLTIRLPALRDRREDIPRLVHAFVREVSEHNDRPFVGITDDAMEILMGHHWPGNVRELRNLIESMVVLAPGREVGPADIPEEVRSPGSTGTMLPAPAQPATEGEAVVRPELEFVFRTLVDLRVDVDDLRREFEEYRREIGEPSGEVGVAALTSGDVEVHYVTHPPVSPPTSVEVDADGWPVGHAEETLPPPPVSRPEEEGVVVYRPGMTIEELERAAIVAALDEVGGNRRKAAESLGIGERTLYRKIEKFGLDA